MRTSPPPSPSTPREPSLARPRSQARVPGCTQATRHPHTGPPVIFRTSGRDQRAAHRIACLADRPQRGPHPDVVHAGAYDIGWLYPGRPRQAVAERWLGLGPAMVIVSSRRGYMVVRESGSVTHWPPPAPARLVDKAGAKETFTAVLLGALHDRAQK